MVETANQKGSSPVIRASIRVSGDAGFKDVLVLWPKKEGAEGKYDLSGTLEGQRVVGFIRHPDGRPPFVSLRAHNDQGEYTDVGTLNAINKSNAGKPVYFDTLALNFADKDRDPVFARVTNAMSEELHAQVGFTSPRVTRPGRQAPAAEEASQEDQDGLVPS